MVFEKVRKMIAEQLNKKASEITMESEIINDLGADSLDVVEMLMVVETEFKVSIPDEKAIEMKTVGDIVTFIEHYKK